MQISVGLALTKPRKPPSGGAPASTAGEPIGLLLALTKAS